jgi:preprotein translocase subunit SecF
MLRRYKRMPIDALLDLAMNSMLSRTIITSSTTFLAVLGLFFFGPEVIQGFTQAMLFGIIVGVYSSAFIAAPLLIYLGVRTQGSEAPADEPAAAEAKAKQHA